MKKTASEFAGAKSRTSDKTVAIEATQELKLIDASLSELKNRSEATESSYGPCPWHEVVKKA